IHIHESDTRREEADGVVRYINLLSPCSFVLYMDVPDEAIDGTIDRQIAYFDSMGHDFEWKVFSHDRPSDLADRLAERGFSRGELETIMALDLSHLPEALARPVTHDVRRITDPGLVRGILAIQREVFEDDDDAYIVSYLETTLRDHPHEVSFYAAYVDDIPVSAAWLRMPAHSPFASLWGGATLEAYRGRGLYTALVAVRTQEAKTRGYQFLTIDASDMSRPICEKQGFVKLCTTRECEWKRPDAD
ncbi:MAG: GNAT family N-acetyltransferase, partial [Anaerolineae bacterium]|nr:GNAT family N-acetyltransferase [Anaerolineae bacterium]